MEANLKVANTCEIFQQYPFSWMSINKQRGLDMG